MVVRSRRLDGETIVEVSGRLDLRVAPELKHELRAALGEGHGSLVVDLSHVEFMDSSALAAFVRIHREAEEQGGHLVLVMPDGPESQVFSLTNTDRFFTLCNTVDEALALTPGRAVRDDQGRLR